MAAPHDLVLADDGYDQFPHSALDEERIGGLVIRAAADKWDTG